MGTQNFRSKGTAYDSGVATKNVICGHESMQQPHILMQMTIATGEADNYRHRIA
jgi:hypothetical protein